MQHSKAFDGSQWVLTFSNGYGLSVVCHKHSYGGKSGLFEAALLHNNELCYQHADWPDVRGWLTFEEVARTIEEVRAYRSLPICRHAQPKPWVMA